MKQYSFCAHLDYNILGRDSFMLYSSNICTPHPPKCWHIWGGCGVQSILCREYFLASLFLNDEVR